MNQVRAAATFLAKKCVGHIIRGIAKSKATLIAENSADKQKDISALASEPKSVFIIGSISDYDHDLIDKVYQNLDFNIRIKHAQDFDNATRSMRPGELALAISPKQEFLHSSASRHVNKASKAIKVKEQHSQTAYSFALAVILGAMGSQSSKSQAAIHQETGLQRINTIKSGCLAQLMGANDQFAVVEIRGPLYKAKI